MTNRSTFHDINFTGSLLQNGSAFAGSPWTVSGDHLTYTTGNVAVGTSSTTNTSQAKHTVQGISRITNGTQSVDMTAVAGSGLFNDTGGVSVSSEDGQSADAFGFGVAISGDGNYILSGAIWEKSGSTSAGAAYVFIKDGGTFVQQAKLTKTSRQSSDIFGERVSLSDNGDTAAIQSTDSCEIWVRSGTSWSRQAALGHGDVSVGLFIDGVDLSGDGNTCMYGCAQEHSNGLSDNGVVRVSVRSGTSWSQQALLTASDRGTNYYFGCSCALAKDGNTAVVGSYRRAPSNNGAAYIFVRSGTSWSQQAILNQSFQSTGAFAGYMVKISSDGNTVAMGVYGANSFNGGAAIFVRSGTSWSQQALLNNQGTGETQLSGVGIALSSDGNTFCLGAPGDDQGSTNTGRVDIFKRSGTSWSHSQSLRGGSPSIHKQFGCALALDDDFEQLVVGVPDGLLAGPTHQGNPSGISGYSPSAGRIEVFKRATAFFAVSVPVTAQGTQLSFTGQHLCFPEGPIERGLVVSANRNKFMNLNGPLTTGLAAIKSSESLPIVSLSNVVNDSTVFGVVDRVESLHRERSYNHGTCLVRSDKEWGDNRAIINSLGEGAIWVVNTNGNISSGEYITTSNIIGYGHKQDDDILHSYTVAKITMDCNFNPEDIPIQVIKKDENGNNILDQYSRLQWEDTDRTQKMYDIKYITVDGDLTDQANSVCTAAYVGCTYHCG